MTAGTSGAAGEDVLVRDGEERRVDAKTTLDLAAGDVVSIRTPGGGGYGDPADRDSEAIARDLRLGKLMPEAALERYGVEPDGLAEE